MYSIGIDLIKHTRFEKLKKNLLFLEKVFNKSELDYIEKRYFNNSTIAGLYAAKEAFLKSIKKGINDYSLKDIEIMHDDNNAPYVELHNELKKLYNRNSISISISHDGDYTTSICLIEL